MGTGAITAYIDVAQIALYAFWIFFAGLIYYLHREDKREGYPLESERSPNVRVQGWPRIPSPKAYHLSDGRVVMSPNFRVSNQPLGADASRSHLGSPLEPNGDPMLAAVGPGSYADRADIADTTVDGALRIVPLRAAADFSVSSHDPDPRGLPVIGADGLVAGTVREMWVDRAEVLSATSKSRCRWRAAAAACCCRSTSRASPPPGSRCVRSWLRSSRRCRPRATPMP